MPSYFPRQTVEWKLGEPRAFRRLSFSLVEMGAVTGILLRIFRSFAITHGSNSWWYLGGSFALGLIFLLLMTTAHLANFPIHRWLWRAPLFVLVEWAGEMLTSLFLIWVGRESWGTARAEWHDWPAMAANAIMTRGAIVILWALLLAGIVQIVRKVIAGSVEDEKDDEQKKATA